MRILLINPPYTNEQRYGKDMAQFGPCNEPLGLAYVAAALEEAGHEVQIWDGQVRWKQLKGNVRIPIGLMEKADLIGLTMNTPSYNIVRQITRESKQLFPHIPIIVGGPHPTLMPYQTLTDNPEIDFVIRGEGEKIIVDLANMLEAGYRPGMFTIPGLDCNDPEIIPDLDTLPLPARHLLPMDAYKMTASRRKKGHAFTVSVARGCPFKCGFCSRLFGKTVRYHSVGRIIQEIDLLVRDYGAQEINLEADTLTLNSSFVHSLCHALIDTGLNKRIAWTCESRVDTVDKDMLKHMKEAGCWQISYGVETGTQRLLDLIQKGITLEKVRQTFKITKQVGINIRAFFMLGLPTETREESLETIRFAKELGAGWSQFTLFTPFPGTELFDFCQRSGESLSENWADYKTHGGWEGGSLAYVPRGRTEQEMKALQKQAYRAVYFQPKKVWKMIQGLTSWAQFKEYFKGFMMLVKTRFA